MSCWRGFQKVPQHFIIFWIITVQKCLSHIFCWAEGEISLALSFITALKRIYVTVDRKDSPSGLAAHSTCSALNQVEKLLAPAHILLLPPPQCTTASRVMWHSFALPLATAVHHSAPIGICPEQAKCIQFPCDFSSELTTKCLLCILMLGLSSCLFLLNSVGDWFFFPSLSNQHGSMSLFKARDWWSAVLGEGEEFDQGCLCVGDVDNSGTGHGQCGTDAPITTILLIQRSG